MIDEQELESIDGKEATEALKLLIAEGEALLRQGVEDFGEFKHWASLAFTSLEPLPDHQEHFNLKCWQKRGPVYFRIREGVHLLKQSLRKMADPEFRVDDPSLGYRRLIMSLPD